MTKRGFFWGKQERVKCRPSPVTARGPPPLNPPMAWPGKSIATICSADCFRRSVYMLPCTMPKRDCVQGSMNTDRSEEHTSELQSHLNLVCRLLLEKKKKNKHIHIHVLPRA